MKTDTTIPTVKEELERKTLEILTFTAGQIANGAIEKRAAYVIGKAIWTLTAGLVDESVSSLAAALADENVARGFRRVFIGNEPTKSPLLMIVVPGEAYLLFKIDPTDGSRSVLKHKKMPPIELEEHVAKVVESLKAGGYNEI
jgi:hypothetical protein